ncbi:hypothetical protein JXA56_05295 [Candidatus Micrarchaeota archaeon]|nr:hypothetical protein [Candidatus Micrarchaeota archaeon]
MALVLFLMANLAFAVEPMDLTFAVPAVAIIVAIVLASVAMLATAISDPRLEAWTKTELRELIAGVIIIALITGFFISSNSISIALTGEGDYLNVSKTVLDSWIAEYDTAFIHIIRAATKLRAAATYSPYMNIPLWYVSISYSTNPLGGVGILLGTMNLTAQALTNAIFISEGIRLLVVFMEIAAPRILLPAAFVMRLIPFTRKLGNTMIAICIAGMVFLPFSIILADNLNDLINVPHPRPNLNLLDANPWAMVMFEPLCESQAIRTLLSLTDVVFALLVCLPVIWIPGAYPVCYNVTKEIVYPLINVVFQLAGTAMMTAWEGYFTGGGGADYVNDVFGVLHPFFVDVSNLVLVGYLDFILIAIVTIAGARSLSAALGGEWYMAGVQRLI